MAKIVALARCRYGAAKNQEESAETWTRVMAEFPQWVRNHAANMAAHSHDVTLIDDRRLLISCSWYNTQGHTGGTGYFYKDGQWSAISPSTYDRLYSHKQKIASSDGTRSDERENTINTEYLA